MVSPFEKPYPPDPITHSHYDALVDALDGTEGCVKLCQFHNNQHFNTTGVGFKIYRKVQGILVMGHIFYGCGGDAVDVDDDGAGNKCSRINIGPVQIDGQSMTPNGVEHRRLCFSLIVGYLL